MHFEPVRASRVLPDLLETPLLVHACNELHDLKVVTPYPPGSTYHGKPITGSNGNVSIRSGNGFLVTATKLPSKHDLTPEDLVFIRDVTNSAVTFDGEKLPTVESLLHAHLYDRFPDVRVVIHGHIHHSFLRDPERMKRAGLVETARPAEEGAAAAEAVDAVLTDWNTQVVVMKGHAQPWDPEHIGFLLLDASFETGIERLKTLIHQLKS